MTEADYHRYIEAFNARDYSALETFFADNFALENAGFRVEGKPAFHYILNADGLIQYIKGAVWVPEAK